ncbi:hypothetical protein [Viscerimonas tarda]
MEILINELSLIGQFTTAEQFVKDALLPLSSLLKEIDTTSNLLYKKQDLWSYPVTASNTLHDILIKRGSDEVTRFKSLLSNLINDPYWESVQEHSVEIIYICNGRTVTGYSLAEACERDKIVISFVESIYSTSTLQVIKGIDEIELNNLFAKEDYIELSFRRRIIPYAEYFEWNFANGRCSLLDNTERFSRTHENRQGQVVYKEIDTGKFWYLDNLHRDHYEVFDSDRKHIGIANLQGTIDTTRRVNGRTL